MPDIIIISFILLYAGWVIRRKLKRIKDGRFCDCGCGDCEKRGCGSQRLQ